MPAEFLFDFLTALSRDIGFWTACLCALQECKRHCERVRDGKRMERLEASAARLDLQAYLGRVRSWHARVGDAAAAAVRELDSGRLGAVAPSEVRRRADEVEAVLGELLGCGEAEARITEALASEAGDGTWRAADLRSAARAIAGRIVEDDLLWRVYVRNEIELVRLRLHGGVSDEDMAGMFACLRDIAREYRFLNVDTAARHEAEERWRFIPPPVAVGGREFEAFTAADLLGVIRGAPGMKAALRGAPGSGKSRLVRELASHLFGCADTDALLPLYLPPSIYERWTGLGNVVEKLVRLPGMVTRGVDERKSVRLMLHRYRHRILFILDGLDQADRECLDNLLTAFDGLAPFPFLIAGREEGFGRIAGAVDAFDLPFADMKPLGKRHTVAFMEASIPAEPAAFRETVRRDLDRKDRVYDTPLMLALLADVATDPPAAVRRPLSELELIGLYLERMEERSIEQRPSLYGRHFGGYRPGKVRGIWEAVAWAAFAYWNEEDGRAEPRVQHLGGDFVHSAQLRAAVSARLGTADREQVEFALRCGLIARGGGSVFDVAEGYDEADRIPAGGTAFIHLVIQEYLAACALARELRRAVPAGWRRTARLEGEILPKMTFERLQGLAGPRVTENTARLLAELLNGREFTGQPGCEGWADRLLAWVLAEDCELVHETPGPAAGLEELAGAERRNALRSNLLYLAMAVRDMRHRASVAGGRGGGGADGGYRAHEVFESLQEERRTEARRRQAEFTARHADRLEALRADWPEVLGPFERWCAIPPGTSVIGGWEYPNEQPVRKLRFPAGREAGGLRLLVCRDPVTNVEYRRFVEETGYNGSDPEWHLDHMRDDGQTGFRGDDQPVVYVTWHDAAAYCTWLADRSGLKVRLPWELEWEYACRAGTDTPFYFGWTVSTEQANYDGNITYGAGEKGEYREVTTPVGTFPGNGWGLRDMHGNVWEWCLDVYAEDAYGREAGAVERDEAGEGPRVLRGGSWCNYPGYLRSSYRVWSDTSYWNGDYGFRVVLSPE
jgi:formylglycine-generating enzyme required for sulfatase activity